MSPNFTRARLGRPLTSPMRKTPRGPVRASSADLISNIISVDLRCDFRWTQLANFSRLQRRHERHGARFFEQTGALHLRARCGPRPRARSGCRTQKAAVGRTSSREGALFTLRGASKIIRRSDRVRWRSLRWQAWCDTIAIAASPSSSRHKLKSGCSGAVQYERAAAQCARRAT